MIRDAYRHFRERKLPALRAWFAAVIYCARQHNKCPWTEGFVWALASTAHEDSIRIGIRNYLESRKQRTVVERDTHD